MSTEDWQTPKFRQCVVLKIHDMLQATVSDPSKNATIMENHIYKKARNKDEYLGLLAKLFMHFKEMVSRRNTEWKSQQPTNADMVNSNVMQDPLDALQNLAINNS